MNEWVQAYLDSLEEHRRCECFERIFKTWKTRVRAASLREENWHAFGKGSTAKDRGWVTDFARQASAQVLENHTRRFRACGNVVVDLGNVGKAVLRDSVRCSSVSARRRLEKNKASE